MSRLEERIADALRGMWGLLTIRAFAYWEILLLLVVVGRRDVPGWQMFIAMLVWIIGRNAQTGDDA